MPATVSDLAARLAEDLRSLSQRHPRLHFATSLGLEDMVITDVIARHRLPIVVFTLDTGRLHEETYSLLQTLATTLRAAQGAHVLTATARPCRP